jgi:hypothetical protein
MQTHPQFSVTLCYLPVPDPKKVREWLSGLKLGTMPLSTLGFDTAAQRSNHWAKHHKDFEPPPISEADYEQAADDFLTCPKRPMMLECIRSDGRFCRYDRASSEFAVLAADRRIVTYFKPKPGIHGHRTNEAYFHANC